MTHHPLEARYLGTDDLNNHMFEVPSGSRPGEFHKVTVWADGSGAVCTCQAYNNRGYCGMTQDVALLHELAIIHESAVLADEILVNLEDPDYDIESATARAQQLLATPLPQLDPAGGNGG